jgi:uncharacterized protein (UPF0332 family)
LSEAKGEVNLAEEALADFKHLENVSVRRQYVTLYFSLYHAARAVLLSRSMAPKTHSGQDSLVHNALHRQEKLLTEEEVALYSKLRTRREQADYETDFLGTEEELNEIAPKAESLVEKLVSIVR